MTFDRVEHGRRVLRGLSHMSGLIQALEMSFEIHEDGRLVYRMPIGEIHTGGPSVAHGGAVMALMDTALGGEALLHATALGRSTSTVEMKTNCLSPGRQGEVLETRTEIVHRGKSLVVVSGEALDSSSGRKVACGIGTFNLYSGEFADQILAFLQE